MNITVLLNNHQLNLDVQPNETLIDLLRDRLGLRGTVEGCGVGVCGSCTVLLDNRPVSSCLVLAPDVAGRHIVSIEGLLVDGKLDSVQEAFLEHHAFQCGYCTAGMIMATKGLLSENPHPTRAQAKDYLSGNLCRCGTYEEVLAAIESLAASDRDVGSGSPDHPPHGANSTLPRNQPP